MTVEIIPIGKSIEKDGAQSFSYSCDGVDYRLIFRFNTRDNHWFFDLYRQDVQIRTGIKVVINYPFLRNFSRIDRPAGELMALDTRELLNARKDPDFTELGSKVLMTYITADTVIVPITIALENDLEQTDPVVTQVPIWVFFNTTVTGGYDLEIVKDNVMAYGATLTTGDDVIFSAVENAVLNSVGVVSGLVYIGTAPGLGSQNNITITVTQVSNWDRARIIRVLPE